MKDIGRMVKNLRLLIKIAYNEDRILFIGYFLTAIFSVVFLFASYYLYKVMIDQVFKGLTSSVPTGLFITIITYLFFQYLSQFVNGTLNSYYFEYLLRSKFQNVLTRHFMKKLSDLDFANLENGEIRNLIAKVADTYTWRIHDNLRMLNNIIYNVAAIIASLVIGLHFHIAYFIGISVLAIPVYFLRAKYGDTYWSIYTSQSKKVNYLWYLRYLFTEFPTLAEIKLYQLSDYFLRKTKQVQDELVDQYKKPIISYTILSTLSSIVFPVIIFFALKNLSLEIIQKKYSLGDFTLFLNTLYTFIGQISNLLLNLGIIYENSLFVDDFFKLQNVKNTVVNVARPIRLDSFSSKEIRFVNVSFVYPGSKKYALKNISLTIKKGEDIAIVGHNGAGKTTLIKLLLRFYDPVEGKITVDGIDLKKIDVDDWYAHLSVLFQDFAKYNLTVEENVFFGDVKKENKSKVRSSLADAQGSEVLGLKGGLKQMLGNWFENGQDVSVGQWQKIAIARALYRNSPFLILDEPTSNIDPQAEYEIFNNLKKIYKEKNLIFISHRFSTVRMADKIYVLEKGQLVESGTHEQLLKNDKLYAKFFNIQKKGYE